MKKGFGILEVLVAALVLGFLIVGLNTLQKGNRESILRVRARDAASFVATHVLDSISAAGPVKKNDTTNVIYYDTNYVYSFEGKPQLDKKNTSGIKMETKYTVEVTIQDENETKQVINETTPLINAMATTKYKEEKEDTVISVSLEAMVSWRFKDSWQSIRMAKVVR